MDRLTANPAATKKSPFQWLNSVFGREIVSALIVKCLLLGLLWWCFFADNKPSVNDERVAAKLLGDAQTVLSSPRLRRTHQ